MNELRIFDNSEFGKVRATTRDGEPWFVAADVCRALDIVQNRNAVARLDNDEKGVCLMDTLGGAQEMSIVNEPGLYSLILSSRKPQAKAFKRWITHEVIPSIRKTGGYIAGESNMSEAELIQAAMTVLQNKVKMQAEKIESQATTVKLLDKENSMLAEKFKRWDKREFIYAAINRYGACIRYCPPHSRIGAAWNEYNHELYAVAHIRLRTRFAIRKKKAKNKSRVRLMDCFNNEKELATGVAVIVAMCRRKNVDISDLLEHIDYVENAAIA